MNDSFCLIVARETSLKDENFLLIISLCMTKNNSLKYENKILPINKREYAINQRAYIDTRPTFQMEQGNN